MRCAPCSRRPHANNGQALNAFPQWSRRGGRIRIRTFGCSCSATTPIVSILVHSELGALRMQCGREARLSAVSSTRPLKWDRRSTSLARCRLGQPQCPRDTAQAKWDFPPLPRVVWYGRTRCHPRRRADDLAGRGVGELPVLCPASLERCHRARARPGRAPGRWPGLSGGAACRQWRAGMLCRYATTPW